MIRAVLFDLDGVLVDSYEVWFHLVRTGARDLGYPPVTREQFHETWGQGVEADVKSYYGNHTIEEIERYYNDHFPDHVAHMKTDPQGPAVFAALRAERRGIAVVTNTPARTAKAVLKAAALNPDVLVGGTDVPHAKPAPDMVLRATEVLKVDRSEAALVGDSRFDREAAKAAGVRFLGFRTEGDIAIQELNEIPPLIEQM